MATRKGERAAAGGAAENPALAAFRAALGGVFDLAATAEEALRFRGSVRAEGGRGFVVARLEASGGVLLPARGAPEAAVFALLGEGELQPKTDAAALRLTQGGVILIDPSEPIELRFAAPARVTMLAANRSAVSERFAAESLWHGLVIEPEAASAKVFGGALEEFARGLDRAGGAEAEALAQGLVDLASRAANVRLGAAAGGEALDTLTQVRRFIDRNLASTKLDTAMVARAFCFSQASLYRLFAPLGGVASYIRKARLARARRIVAAPQMADRRIAEIAHATGFRSATVFNRLFLAEFGTTPSEARAEGLRGVGPAAPVGQGDLARRLRALV